MAAQPATTVPMISPAEMQILISRAGLVLNPGQMADLVLAWRQVAGLIAAIPQGRKLTDDMALTFRLPPPAGATSASRAADKQTRAEVDGGSVRRTGQAARTAPRKPAPKSARSAAAGPALKAATARSPKTAASRARKPATKNTAAAAHTTAAKAAAAKSSARAKVKLKAPTRRPASRRR